MDSQCDPLWLKITIPAATFVGGFFVNQLFLARKDRLTRQQNRFTNMNTLLEKQGKAYIEYTSSLRDFTSPSKDRTQEVFDQMAVCGDNYFRALRSIADAVLSGDVGQSVRDNTCIPLLREAVERSLPEHYDALKSIAKDNGFTYDGELRRENYESIYAAVEKFAHSAAWRAARDEKSGVLTGGDIPPSVESE